MLNTERLNSQSQAKEDEQEDEKDEEAEAVLKVITKLTGGYNRIARRFVMPCCDKHKKFAHIQINLQIQQLESCVSIVEFSGIQKS